MLLFPRRVNVLVLRYYDVRAVPTAAGNVVSPSLPIMFVDKVQVLPGIGIHFPLAQYGRPFHWSLVSPRGERKRNV